jgi:streptogramin lyase
MEDVVLPVPVKSDCTSAAIQYIYVIGESGVVYSFDPAAGAITAIQQPSCPKESGSPFSMAVDRSGHAYVLYSDTNIYRVSLATGACAATPYIQDQLGFDQYGMGFSTDQGGPSETLYIAGDSNGFLGKLDTTTYGVSIVAALPGAQPYVELTGTGDGRLYGLYADDPDYPPSYIVQIDKKTGLFSKSIMLPDLALGNGWAFGFWGGDFYVFSGGLPAGQITRVVGATHEVISVGSVPGDYIVGAGVSTCAPEK